MSSQSARQRSFRIHDGSFEEARAFAEGLLARKDVSREKASETLLVLEALLQELVDWGLDEDTELEVSGAGRLGEYRIELGFEGDPFVFDDGPASLEGRILDGHSDRIDCSYYSGRNEIAITVNRSNRTSMHACMIAAACAIVVYLILRAMLDREARVGLIVDYILPLEKVFANAALMVGAPMTFFSLLRNLTDAYVVSRRGSDIRALHARTFATSVFAIVLAFAAWPALSPVLEGLGGTAPQFKGSLDRSFADIVTSSVPSSIFEPFEVISPIPLIVVAFLCTYAMCSAGKYFEPLRQAMMAGYTLFSRMLAAVIAALPPFCFLAVLDVLLDADLWSLLEIGAYAVAVCLGIALLLATYAIRLAASGIDPIAFARQAMPMLRENWRIGSVIDATSYNIRYCSKVLKMDRTLLERNMPVLAQTNLDGNCFLLMLFALVFIFMTNTSFTWLNLVVLAALILFLSLGAPNQPGSILIGCLIITMYLKSFEVVAMAIIAEALLAGAQNLINVIGNIVMVAIDDHKLRA